ncbi:MAG: DUF427 domain-containing protein [Actinomycetota bacterium]
MSSRPAAEGIEPGWYPQSPVDVGHVEPVPRRVRAVVDGRTVVDSTDALYVWEHPWYPQFYVPASDVDASRIVHTGRADDTHQVGGEVLYLEASSGLVPAGSFIVASSNPALVGTYRFAWDAFDAWFEEDEEVFGHPRNPYVRVDPVRSTRQVHVHLDGVTLARSSAPIAVFETGLPPRWYHDRSTVEWQHLRAIDLRTLCPYKGHTTGYWSVEVRDRRVDEVAWSYDFPTRQLSPIAGLVAFDDTRVVVDVE